MNYFLIVIIIGLCGGGYYEYNQFQQKSAADAQQISTLTDKVNSLQADNKKLEDAGTVLKKNVDDATAEVADLTRQVQDAQTALTAAKAQAATAEAKIIQLQAAASTAAAPTKPTNDLGTVATLDGKSYRNCELLKVEADGVILDNADGITKIVYGLLPPELQKRFGYDPHGPPTLTQDQVDYQEAQRKAIQGLKN